MINTASELDIYIKIIVGTLTGITIFLGLPLVLLNYKKTQAEIKKLDLEAKAINNNLPVTRQDSINHNQDVHVNIEQSPHSNVQILTDPRFLAPLLLLVDFIVAWVVLTILKYLLSFFPLGEISDILLIGASLLLLIPIFKQAIEVKLIIQPNITEEEIQASVKNIKIIIYSILGTILLASFAFIALIFFSDNTALDTIGGKIIISIIAIGSIILLISSPFIKTFIDTKIENMYRKNSNKPIS